MKSIMALLISGITITTTCNAESNKCMWFKKPSNTAFEHTIKIERIKQDLRSQKIKIKNLSEKELFKLAETMYCKD